MTNPPRLTDAERELAADEYAVMPAAVSDEQIERRNNPQFTDVPWSVGGDNGYLNQIAINPSIGCAYGAGEEVKANALVMAAAPDLYHACNGLLGLLQLIESRCDPMLLDIIRTNYRVHDAKAAVDKARGAKP